MTIQIHALNVDPGIKVVLAAMQAEIADLRAKHVGLAAKLDADAGVTDTNFTALWSPNAVTVTP